MIKATILWLAFAGIPVAEQTRDHISDLKLTLRILDRATTHPDELARVQAKIKATEAMAADLERERDRGEWLRSLRE